MSDEPGNKTSGIETNSCAKFRIGDDVVVTRWHAPAKVKGFIYELEEPFQYPERERDLSPPAQKAGACPPIDAKLNASIEAVAKVLQEEAASDPTFPVRGVANYAGLAGRIIRAVAGSKEKS